LRHATATGITRWIDLARAQSRLHTVLRINGDRQAYLRAIRSLIKLALSVLAPDDLPNVPDWASHAMNMYQHTSSLASTPPPLDASTVAAVLPTVMAIIAGGRDAYPELELLVGRARDRSAHIAYRIPALLPSVELAATAVQALSRDGVHTIRLGLAVRRLPGGGTRRTLRYGPEHVPPLLPTAWDDPIIALTGRQRHDQVRRIASIILVRLAIECTWTQAIAALALQQLVSDNAPTTLLTELHRQGTIADWMDHVRARAHDLDGDHSVNYRAQREALCQFTIVDAGFWETLCAANSLRTRRDAAKPRHAAGWIWSQLTRSDPRLSPALRLQRPVADADTISRYHQFCNTMTPAVRGALIAHAGDDVCPALGADTRPLESTFQPWP